LKLFRYSNTLNKASGISKGLNGAIQRLVINGNSHSDLVGIAKNFRGISKYVGPPCYDTNEIDDANSLRNTNNQKCFNGGQCLPYLRSYICKCPQNFMGTKCEKSKFKFSNIIG